MAKRKTTTAVPVARTARAFVSTATGRAFLTISDPGTHVYETISYPTEAEAEADRVRWLRGETLKGSSNR